MKDLIPAQCLDLVEIFRLAHYDPESAPGNELSEGGLRGEGVSLQLSGAGRTAVLEINADGPDIGYMTIAPFYDEKGELRWGVPPPR